MMARFNNDGVNLSYADQGKGMPLVLQYGLGADAGQPLEVVSGNARSIVLECRGHGASKSGKIDQLSIPTFTNDLAALIDYLRLDRPVVGGISMGAAMALRYAVEHRDRVAGLILARPAWLTKSALPNMRIFAKAASCMADTHGGVEKFKRSMEFAQLQNASPDNVSSVLGQFDTENQATRAALLEAIANDGPRVARQDVALLDSLPSLIIGNRTDEIHPLAFAQELASLIPSANFVEITGKSVSKERYFNDFKGAIQRFFHSLSNPAIGRDD